MNITTLNQRMQTLIQALQAADFPIVDAGDATYQTDGNYTDGVLPWANIICSGDSTNLISESARLQSFLDTKEPNVWTVEAAFYPKTLIAVLIATDQQETSDVEELDHETPSVL